MISAVITAAGSGTRFGADKMLIDICGKPLIYWTIEAFRKAGITDIIVVCGDDPAYKGFGVRTVRGGKDRIHSLNNGVAIAQGEIIITHDGARPLATPELIRNVADAVKETGAAMCAVNPTATVKRSDDDMIISETLIREKTWIAQTPQCCRKEIIQKALKKAIAENYTIPTDDSEIVSIMTGIPVRIVPGEHTNIKITHPGDEVIARELMRKGEMRKENEGRRMKIGIGEDSHAFGESPPLTIGGITIPGYNRLLGNSDGDVLLHALYNALSSAIGEGSIGPTADQICARGEKDSKAYLGIIASQMNKKGLRAASISISVEAKTPKMEEFSGEMKQAISRITGCREEDIGITFTSGEGLTSFGQGRGIRATAIALLSEKETNNDYDDNRILTRKDNPRT